MHCGCVRVCVCVCMHTSTVGPEAHPGDWFLISYYLILILCRNPSQYF